MPHDTSPHERSALETFGRMLSGFGAGVQGRTPPFVEEDLTRERMGLEHARTLESQRQFNLSEARAQELLKIQREQLGRQNDLADLQIFEGVAKAIPTFQRVIQQLPEGEARTNAAKEFSALGSRLLRRTGKAVPEYQGFATPSALEALLLHAAPADQVIRSLEFLSPDQRTMVSTFFQTGKPDDAVKGWELAEKMNVTEQERIISGLSERLRKRPSFGRTVQDVETALGEVQSSPQEQKVVANLIRRTDPTKMEALYREFGIEPPGVAAKRGEKVQDIYAEAAPKALTDFLKDYMTQQTPGGQADIALKNANRVRALVEAGMAQYKTIPGTGGAIISVPLPPEYAKILGVPALTLPVPAGLVGGTVAPGAPQTKVSGQPGVSVVAETPGPPVSGEAVQKIVSQEAVTAQLGVMSQILHDPTSWNTVKPFIGPGLSTLSAPGVQRTLAKKTPLMEFPEQYVLLKQAEQIMENERTRTVSGAAVSVTEGVRLKEEMPNLEKDKPENYRLKADYYRTLMTVIEKRMKELYSPDGLRKIGVNPEDVWKKYPLPWKFSADSDFELAGSGHITGRPGLRKPPAPGGR